MKYILLVCSVFFSVGLFAQTNFYKSAERKFEEHRYGEAIDLYKQAYKKGNSDRKCECLWKIAECYRIKTDSVQAKVWYNKVVVGKCPNAEKAQAYINDSKNNPITK